MRLLRQLLLLVLGVRLIQALPQSGPSSSQLLNDDGDEGTATKQQAGLLGLLGLGGLAGFLKFRKGGNTGGQQLPPNTGGQNGHGPGVQNRNLLAGLEKPLQFKGPFFWGELFNVLGEERYEEWMLCFGLGVQQLLGTDARTTNHEIRQYLHRKHKKETTPKFDEIRDQCLRDKLAYTANGNSLPEMEWLTPQRGRQRIQSDQTRTQQEQNEFRLLPEMKKEITDRFQSSFMTPKPANRPLPLFKGRIRP